MGLVLVDAGLQANAQEWKSNTSTDVNDPGSDYFGAMQGATPNTLVVTNAYGGTRDYAGGLVSNKRKLPKQQDGSLYQYVAMRIGWEWGANVYRQIARHELDCKVCFKTRPNANTKIRNVANFSTQWNRDTGQWQIDKDPPKWIDSGMIVEDIAPDVHHVADFRFWYDPDAAIFSVLSIQLDADCYAIPEELQNVAAQETNWEEIASCQLQNEMYHPGSTLIEYDEVRLGWSTEPIGLHW
jgi:hypothetical protein